MKSESRITRRPPIGASLGMLVVVTLLTMPSLVCADETPCDTKALPSRVLRGVGTCPLCCSDDYVRKPAPCVSPAARCCADTYCPKPCLVLPCPASCCCQDDYCPKPFPTLCRPMGNAWYKCVPAVPCPWVPRATCNPAGGPPQSEACR